jgi:hypothetical protein
MDPNARSSSISSVDQGSAQADRFSPKRAPERDLMTIHDLIPTHSVNSRQPIVLNYLFSFG